MVVAGPRLRALRAEVALDVQRREGGYVKTAAPAPVGGAAWWVDPAGLALVRLYRALMSTLCTASNPRGNSIVLTGTVDR